MQHHPAANHWRSILVSRHSGQDQLNGLNGQVTDFHLQLSTLMGEVPDSWVTGAKSVLPRDMLLAGSCQNFMMTFSRVIVHSIELALPSNFPLLISFFSLNSFYFALGSAPPSYVALEMNDFREVREMHDSCRSCLADRDRLAQPLWWQEQVSRIR